MKIYVVFGANYCSYCHKAVDLLEKNKKHFFYFDIKTNIGKEMLNRFKSIKDEDYHFIPKIYLLDSKFIQGFTELKIHLEKMSKKDNSFKKIKTHMKKNKRLKKNNRVKKRKHRSAKKSKKSRRKTK